jgi:hypothetical protein
MKQARLLAANQEMSQGTFEDKQKKKDINLPVSYGQVLLHELKKEPDRCSSSFLNIGRSHPVVVKGQTKEIYYNKDISLNPNHDYRFRKQIASVKSNSDLSMPIEKPMLSKRYKNRDSSAKKSIKAIKKL